MIWLGKVTPNGQSLQDNLMKPFKNLPLGHALGAKSKITCHSNSSGLIPRAWLTLTALEGLINFRGRDKFDTWTFCHHLFSSDSWTSHYAFIPLFWTSYMRITVQIFVVWSSRIEHDSQKNIQRVHVCRFENIKESPWLMRGNPWDIKQFIRHQRDQFVWVCEKWEYGSALWEEASH